METRSKKLKRLVLLLLTIAMAAWVAARWHVWFGNEPELAAEPFSKPSNVLLTFGDEDELSRNISWQCDTVLRPSFLELIDLELGDTMRIEAQGEVFASRNGQAAYYIARLRQLKPDHAYRYRAVVGPRLGVENQVCDHAQGGACALVRVLLQPAAVDSRSLQALS